MYGSRPDRAEALYPGGDVLATQEFVGVNCGTRVQRQFLITMDFGSLAASP
jgi:hypothetical protein